MENCYLSPQQISGPFKISSKNTIPFSPSNNKPNLHNKLTTQNIASQQSKNFLSPKSTTTKTSISTEKHISKFDSSTHPENTNNKLTKKHPPYKKYDSQPKITENYSCKISQVITNYKNAALNYAQACQALKNINTENSDIFSYPTNTQKYLLGLNKQNKQKVKFPETPVLTQENLRFLARKYSQRITSSRLSYQRSKSPSETPLNYSFCPKTNKNANSLASKAREKLIKKASELELSKKQNTSVPDLLILHKVVSEKYFFLYIPKS